MTTTVVTTETPEQTPVVLPSTTNETATPVVELAREVGELAARTEAAEAEAASARMAAEVAASQASQATRDAAEAAEAAALAVAVAVTTAEPEAEELEASQVQIDVPQADTSGTAPANGAQPGGLLATVRTILFR